MKIRITEAHLKEARVWTRQGLSALYDCVGKTFEVEDINDHISYSYGSYIITLTAENTTRKVVYNTYRFRGVKLDEVISLETWPSTSLAILLANVGNIVEEEVPDSITFEYTDDLGVLRTAKFKKSMLILEEMPDITL